MARSPCRCPPVGLPAALLERRPDVRLAEAQLVAANARIGVAKSEFFPRIFLLGSIGVAGGVQNSVSFGPMGFFGIGPTMSVPIFNMGRVQAGVDSAGARAQEAVIRYQQTVQQALRDVSDALVEHRKRREARREQENLVQVLRSATGLSNVRYDGGVDELSRGAGQRAAALLGGAGPGADPAGRAPGGGPALPGPRRRLDAVGTRRSELRAGARGAPSTRGESRLRYPSSARRVIVPHTSREHEAHCLHRVLACGLAVVASARSVAQVPGPGPERVRPSGSVFRTPTSGSRAAARS